MYCPNCGSFMQDSLKFCTQCGTALHPEFYRQNARQQNPGQYSQTPQNDPVVFSNPTVQTYRKKPNIKFIAIILVAVVAVAVAAFIVINPFDSSVEYAFDYELGYDGYYMDFEDYDVIVSGIDTDNGHGVFTDLIPKGPP